MSDLPRKKTGRLSGWRKRVRDICTSCVNCLLRPFRRPPAAPTARSAVETAATIQQVPSRQEIPVSDASSPEAVVRSETTAIVEDSPEQRLVTVASTSGATTTPPIEESKSSVRTTRPTSIIESYDKISIVPEVEEESTTKELNEASIQVLNPGERTINESGGTVSSPGSSQQLPITSPPSQIDAFVIPDSVTKSAEELVEKQLSEKKKSAEKLGEKTKSAEELGEKQMSEETKSAEELVEKEMPEKIKSAEELVEEQTSKKKKSDISSGYGDDFTLPIEEQRVSVATTATLRSLGDSISEGFYDLPKSPGSDSVFSKDETYDSPKQDAFTGLDPEKFSYPQEFQLGLSSADIQAPEFETFAPRPELIGAANEIDVQEPGPEVGVSDDEGRPEVEVVGALFENVDRPEAEGNSETNTNTSGVGSIYVPHQPDTTELLSQASRILETENEDQNSSEVGTSLSEDNLPEQEPRQKDGTELQPSTSRQKDATKPQPTTSRQKDATEPQSGTSRQKDDTQPQPSTSRQKDAMQPQPTTSRQKNATEPQPGTSRQKDDTEPQTSTSHPQDYTCLSPNELGEISSSSPEDDSVSAEPQPGPAKIRKFTKRLTELKQEFSTSSDEGSMRVPPPPSPFRLHFNSPERKVSPEGEEDDIIPQFLFRIRSPEPPARSPPDGFSASSGIEEDYND